MEEKLFTLLRLAKLIKITKSKSKIKLKLLKHKLTKKIILRLNFH